MLFNEKPEPPLKYISKKKKKNRSTDQSMEQLLDSPSFQSITLALLRRARQDKQIDVGCFGGNGGMEREGARGGDEDTAPQGAETWPDATPPGLTPRQEQEKKKWREGGRENENRGKETRRGGVEEWVLNGQMR